MKQQIQNVDSIIKHCTDNGLFLKGNLGPIRSYLNTNTKIGIEIRTLVPEIVGFTFDETGFRTYENLSSELDNFVCECRDIGLIGEKIIKNECEKMSTEVAVVDKIVKSPINVGLVTSAASQYGIPQELANMFFMKFDEQIYIKNPGLLYLASKKGYSRIEITDQEVNGEWIAECKIYPKLDKETLAAVAGLDKDIQREAFKFLSEPTNGIGRASKASVKMSTMQVFLREMAQTRAQNRALRAYTGYGGTSMEELPEGSLGGE